MRELRADIAFDPGDYDWLKREAQARRIPFKQLMLEIVGELDIHLDRRMTEQQMSELLSDLVRKAVRIARQGAVARDN